MTSKLLQLMSEPLPNISLQKKLAYRTNKREVQELYNLINQEIFDNQLPPAKLQVKNYCRGYWGLCLADGFSIRKKRSQCTIRISDRWYCKQWLITILAHEMAHQYQWDVYSRERYKQGLMPILSHGPSFFAFKDRLREHGITLKRVHRLTSWFKHQRLDR
jgi:hypothetical protein